MSRKDLAFRSATAFVAHDRRRSQSLRWATHESNQTYAC
jgi:hypothetical protein